jgi:pimeloyl-ACP methyl ester carboxylesterase
MAQSVAALRDTDLRSELATIAVPTAILHAAGDRICPFVLAAEMARGIKNSMIIRFEKSGHCLLLQEKEKFNHELMAFAIIRMSIPFLIPFHGGFLSCQVLEHRFPVSPMNAN